MSCLLDTNIISLAMSADAKVLARLSSVEAEGAAISAVTYAEIRYGLQRLSSPAVERKKELFERLLEHLEVLPWDRHAAAAYADERTACERDGQVLDQADLMILAQAASTGRVLVTRDAALRRRDRKGVGKTRILEW
jgi:tRNA(fMet)-specific endonuclease VapC